MIPLTIKQRKLLDYLKSRLDCPSYEEMKDALGLRSKSGVHRLISALEERGFIRRLPNLARAIEIVEEPSLPSALNQFSVQDLAIEARRRNLALGRLYLNKRGQKSFAPVKIEAAT